MPTFPGIMDTTSLGEKLRAYREAAGLTQRRLGELVGRAGSEIYRWEQGIVRIPAEELPRLAQILGVSVTAFFEESSEGEGTPVNWRLHAAAQGLNEETLELVIGILQRLRRNNPAERYVNHDD